jgi:CheY-like chemotaxis protein
MQVHIDPTKLVHLPTVLIAEPDDGLRGGLAGVLSHDGYRVVTVQDGLELFDYLSLAARSAGRLALPRLVVSDVELAGCSGLDACRRLRRLPARLPVVLLASDRMAARAALLAGACDVVKKPVDLNELRGVVALFC